MTRAFGTAFECSGPVRDSARIVCRSPRARVLDRQLAALERRFPTQNAALVDDQDTWLQTLQRCGDSESCLVGLLEERIAGLQHQLTAGAPEHLPDTSPRRQEHWSPQTFSAPKTVELLPPVTGFAPPATAENPPPALEEVNSSPSVKNMAESRSEIPGPAVSSATPGPVANQISAPPVILPSFTTRATEGCAPSPCGTNFHSLRLRAQVENYTAYIGKELESVLPSALLGGFPAASAGLAAVGVIVVLMSLRQPTRLPLWRALVLILAGMLAAGALRPEFLWVPDAVHSPFVAQAALGGVACGLFFKSFGYLDTWLHELGHAFAANLFQGRTVVQIAIFGNQSGWAQSGWMNSVRPRAARWTDAIHSAAGPLASSFTFLGATGLMVMGHSALLLVVSAALALFILLNAVRNFFGWVVGLCILTWLSGSALALHGYFLDGQILEGTVAAVLGGAAGASVLYSWRCIGPNGGNADEAQIAQRFAVTETLVDVGILALNLAALAWALWRLWAP